MYTKKYELIVVIGRYEPYHIAHEDILRRANQLSDNVLVLIGSRYTPRTIKNPWTFDERRGMINSTAHVINLMIDGIGDHTYDDNMWITEVGEYVGSYADRLDAKRVAIIGHDKDHSSFYLNYFPQWDFIPVPSYPSDGESIDATKIRRLMFDGDLEFVRGVVSETIFNQLKDFTKTSAFKMLLDEWNFVKEYKAAWAGSPYEPTFITVDPVVIQSGHVLLIERGEYPGKGLIALPGGFVDPGERIRTAVVRELREETGLKVPAKVLNGTIDAYEMFDDPGRSTRGRTVTHAYRFMLDHTQPLPRVKGQSDAKKAKWYSFAEFEKMENVMYEDHWHIVKHVMALPAAQVRR